MSKVADTSKFPSMMDAITEMEMWGSILAQHVGLEPKEVCYDSSMLHFTFEGPVAKEHLAELERVLRESKYIKEPWACGDFEESTEDFADTEFETVYTLVLYNTEEC
jgi:hypothetical protein